MPYVVFTVLLLGLIVVSFLRFHCQRGHQYRRRQAELNDKLQATGGASSGGGGGGEGHDTLRLLQGSSASSEPGPSSGAQPNGVPQHMSLFLQFSQVRGGGKENPEKTGGVGMGRGEGRRDPSSGRGGGFQVGNHLTSRDPAPASSGRRPLVFTFNVNGSMVDIRCEDEERTNTFHLRPPVPSLKDTMTEDTGLGNGGHSVAGARKTTTTTNPAPHCKNRYYGNNRRHLGSNHSSSSAGSKSMAHAHRTVSYAIPEGRRTTLEKMKDSSEDEALLLYGYKHL